MYETHVERITNTLTGRFLGKLSSMGLLATMATAVATRIVSNMAPGLVLLAHVRPAFRFFSENYFESESFYIEQP